MQYLQQIFHLSCQVHKLLWIDWMLSTNRFFIVSVMYNNLNSRHKGRRGWSTTKVIYFFRCFRFFNFFSPFFFVVFLSFHCSCWLSTAFLSLTQKSAKHVGAGVGFAREASKTNRKTVDIFGKKVDLLDSSSCYRLVSNWAPPFDQLNKSDQ